MISLVILKLPLNGYYYSIPFLCLSLSAALLFNYIIQLNSALKMHPRPHLLRKTLANFVALLLLLCIGVILFKQSPAITADLILKKTYQSEYSFLKSTLDNKKDLKSVYYAPIASNYNDYATSVLMVFLKKIVTTEEFSIYSSTGCSGWRGYSKDKPITCEKRAYNNSHDYNILIIENDMLASINKEKYKLIRHISPINTDSLVQKSLTIAIKNKE